MSQQLGVIVFAVCCAALHLLQPELSVLDDAVSYYMNGRAGWMLGFGLMAMGAGSIRLAWRGRAASKGGSLLLAVWGFGCVLGGIFPPDPRGSWHQPPSLSGSIHSGAAMMAFVAFPAAALILRPRRPMTWAVVASVAVFFVSLSPVFRHKAPVLLGLTERIALAAFVVWLWRASSSDGQTK